MIMAVRNYDLSAFKIPIEIDHLIEFGCRPLLTMEHMHNPELYPKNEQYVALEEKENQNPTMAPKFI
jgi:hypothetical protein